MKEGSNLLQECWDVITGLFGVDYAGGYPPSMPKEFSALKKAEEVELK